MNNSIDDSNQNKEIDESTSDVMKDIPKILDNVTKRVQEEHERVRNEMVEKLTKKTRLPKELIEQFYDDCKSERAKDIEQCILDKVKQHIKNKNKNKNKNSLGNKK